MSLFSTSPAFAVHADGDPGLLARLTADVRNDALLLGWQKGESVRVADRHIRITITMPRVSGVMVSGAGAIAADRAEAPGFSAEVSGAGSIRVAGLRSDRAMLIMGGTGEIVAAGRTGRLDVRVSGVGSIDARRLV